MLTNAKPGDKFKDANSRIWEYVEPWEISGYNHVLKRGGYRSMFRNDGTCRYPPYNLVEALPSNSIYDQVAGRAEQYEAPTQRFIQGKMLTGADLAAMRPSEDMMLQPLPIETYKKDGIIVRLLVDYTEGDNPLDDSAEPCWTIGFNQFEHSENDEWFLVGWDWSHDCFTSGSGKVIGWLPFHSAAAQSAVPVAWRWNSKLSQSTWSDATTWALDAKEPAPHEQYETQALGVIYNPSIPAAITQTAREVLAQATSGEAWPPLKKALWDVLMAERLNDGHYIHAFKLIETLYAAAIASDVAPLPELPAPASRTVMRATQLAELVIEYQESYTGGDMSARDSMTILDEAIEIARTILDKAKS